MLKRELRKGFRLLGIAALRWPREEFSANKAESELVHKYDFGSHNLRQGCQINKILNLFGMHFDYLTGIRA